MPSKFIEVSGKNVKEAIKQGLSELGCDSSDVEIEVLEMGSPGLFGMFGKQAKVRLTLKDSEPDFDLQMPAMTLDQPGLGKKNARQDKKKSEQRQENRDSDSKFSASEPASESKQDKGSRSERKPKSRQHKEAEPQEKEPEVPVEVAPFEATPEDQLSDRARLARDFLTGLTRKMGVEANVAVAELEGHIQVQLSGNSMSILIGRRGETLDAMQYLTRLAVNRGHDDYIRVSIDTENYRAKREEALRKLAVRMAAKAVKTGKSVALEPMNPYERRILHSALQSDPNVNTHSEGEDPYRRVIITLK